MKYLLVATFMIFGFAAAAADTTSDQLGRGIHSLQDDDIGTVEIRSAEGGDAHDVMGVRILCNDKRKLKNTVAPSWESIERLEGIPVCFMSPEKSFIDKKTKILYVNSSKVYLHKDGSFRCKDPEYDRFDMNKFCAPWRN